MSTHGDRSSGFALITAIGVAMLTSILSASIYLVASNQIQAARKTREYLKAKVIAEAGANVRYNGIKHRFTGFGLEDETAFGDGNYQTELVMNQADANQARLISVGRCGIARARIEISLRNFQHFFTNDHVVLQNAITTFSPLRITGTVLVNDGGSIASKVLIDVRSNATSIDGGANAPTVSDKHGTVKGAISNDPSLYDYNWDDFLKLSDYLGHAVLYDGKTDLASYPDNTILYVNGELSINTATPLKLCIIATGDISVSAQCNLQQPGTYPTLVSENGDIDFGGGANVEGLVAAMGVASTISSSGGGNIPVNINGSIVLGGEFNGSGNWCINFRKVTLIPPGEDNTLVMAWQ